jgi:hypothetical protein
MEAADRMKQAGVAFTPLQNARNTIDHEKKEDDSEKEEDQNGNKRL